MIEQLKKIEKRYRELDRKMARPEIATDLSQLQTLAQERAAIEEIVMTYRKYRDVEKSLEETRAMLDDDLDEEMANLARQEIESLEKKLSELKEKLRLALLPKDPNDEKDIIMEIRAGTGGNEAALFAADLFRMYSRYAQAHNWNTDILSMSESGIGGFKEIIFEVKGKGAYSHLKYESGVHRVQR
ncbi:MAG: PCRF domain-containing protein, partial [Dehalococcoidales bacterium]|nr:PCRF domain-containing protein [Dehalococcoidales bacterium]